MAAAEETCGGGAAAREDRGGAAAEARFEAAAAAVAQGFAPEAQAAYRERLAAVRAAHPGLPLDLPALARHPALLPRSWPAEGLGRAAGLEAALGGPCGRPLPLPEGRHCGEPLAILLEAAAPYLLQGLQWAGAPPGTPPLSLAEAGPRLARLAPHRDPCPVAALLFEGGGAALPAAPGAWWPWAYLEPFAGGGLALHPPAGAAPLPAAPPAAPAAAAEPAAARGRRGEEAVARVLRSRFELRETRAQARSGDLQLLLPGGGILLVEVKNYSAPVPRTEVDKFRRDVEAAGGEAGLLVSLGGPLAGMSGGLRLELLPRGRGFVPLVFLARAGEQAGGLGGEVLLFAAEAAAALRDALAAWAARGAAGGPGAAAEEEGWMAAALEGRLAALARETGEGLACLAGLQGRLAAAAAETQQLTAALRAGRPQEVADFRAALAALGADALGAGLETRCFPREGWQQLRGVLTVPGWGFWVEPGREKGPMLALRHGPPRTDGLLLRLAPAGASVDGNVLRLPLRRLSAADLEEVIPLLC